MQRKPPGKPQRKAAQKAAQKRPGKPPAAAKAKSAPAARKRAAPPPPPPAPPRRPSPPRYQPTDKDRRSVEAMTAYGIDQDAIATVLAISPHTIRKYFRKELDSALAKANANVAEKLYSKAMAGEIVAMIFWLKTRARWSERVVVEDAGLSADADMSNLSDAELEARIARLRRTAATQRFVRQNTTTAAAQ